MRAQTIYALSSGAVPSGVAVIRVSGPRARFVLETICQRMPDARQAQVRRLLDPRSGEVLDEALVLWFPAPGSFTGEDVVELQCHGGRAVVARVLEVLGSIEGCRPAEAGEFTRRAFDNDRLDLLQAEALADLINADTEAQRRQAVRQLGGDLGRIYDAWRSRLLRARAMIEAELDFAEEEDVPGAVSDRIWSDVAALGREIAAHLTAAKAAERLREGLQVALVGKPNAGKSSLLNALARRDVAIVTEEAGTTRDVIEVHLDLGGYPVTLVDTAGVREATGLVEREGIRRGLARARTADLVLLLSEPADPVDAKTVADLGFGPETDVWIVGTKSDLQSEGSARGEVSDAGHRISVKTGSGIGDLIDAIGAFAETRLGLREDPVATRARHRHHLEDAAAALTRAEAGDRPLELRAEDLRQGADALGRIAGRIGVEDMLDVIFREFCIGK
ncbi:tRNA uridine-5-carboxymethylaminomethyl(34) synthesis GTPase MnmE [Stappia sp.]|uniref:tRNA uridine-5-carboxymethylaminomethyl(34) synthesis GTPase MnmE n=1 Tax=Stappia sp. TaxID=1870903 RepID=UPI0032D97AB0